MSFSENELDDLAEDIRHKQEKALRDKITEGYKNRMFEQRQIEERALRLPRR